MGTWDDIAVVPSDGAPRAGGSGASGEGKRARTSDGSAKRQRAYDFWDAQIDKGHVRKTKANREARMEERRRMTASWLSKSPQRGGKGHGGKGRSQPRGGK